MFKTLKSDSKIERDKKDLSSSNYIPQKVEYRGSGVTGSSLGYGVGQVGYHSL